MFLQMDAFFDRFYSYKSRRLPGKIYFLLTPVH